LASHSAAKIGMRRHAPLSFHWQQAGDGPAVTSNHQFPFTSENVIKARKDRPQFPNTDFAHEPDPEQCVTY